MVAIHIRCRCDRHYHQNADREVSGFNSRTQCVSATPMKEVTVTVEQYTELATCQHQRNTSQSAHCHHLPRQSCLVSWQLSSSAHIWYAAGYTILLLLGFVAAWPWLCASNPTTHHCEPTYQDSEQHSQHLLRCLAMALGGQDLLRQEGIIA